MRTSLLIVLLVAAVIIAGLQYTPLRFLSANSTDFVWGVAVGSAIAGAIALYATRAGIGSKD